MGDIGGNTGGSSDIIESEVGDFLVEF